MIKPGWTGRFFEDFEVGDVYEHPLGQGVDERDKDEQSEEYWRRRLASAVWVAVRNSQQTIVGIACSVGAPEGADVRCIESVLIYQVHLSN